MQEIEQIAKLATNLGLMTVFVSVVIWLIWRYGPRVAEAYASMVDGVKESNAKMAEATEKLTESMVQVQDQGRYCQSTNAALGHHCDAMEHLASGHSKEKEILRSVNAMRAVLSVTHR